MLNRKRTAIPFMFLFGWIIILAFKLLILQICMYDHFCIRLDKQANREIYTQPIRGNVYDNNGTPLAMSIETVSCVGHPSLLEDLTTTVTYLKDKLNLDETSLVEKLTSPRQFVWLKRKLNPEEAGVLRKNLPPGIELVREVKRYYPNGDLAWHLLGRVGVDDFGLSGIEKTWDEVLRGEKVSRVVVRNGLREQLFTLTSNSNESKLTSEPGKKSTAIPYNNSQIFGRNIYLTLVKEIQYIAERELDYTLKHHQAKLGIVVIQNPFTGEILGLACRPAYPENEWRKNPQLLNNPAACYVLEPGSVFKPFTVAAGLEEKIISVEEKIFCEKGKYEIYGREIKDHDPQGMLNIAEILQYSSNIGTAKIALRLSKEKLYQYICLFGFGSATGLCLPGETRGLVSVPSSWHLDSLPTISFGQEIGVTAIQLACAYSALANGGVLLEPMLVKKIVDSNGIVLKTFTPTVVRRTVSEPVIRKLIPMMESVIEKGTGAKAQVTGYRAAGKTGTAQKIDPITKKYSETKHIATFCGFLPLPRPEVTIIVIVDEPVGDDYWGGTVAAPLFARIAKQVMEKVRIPAKENMLVTNSKNVPVKPIY